MYKKNIAMALLETNFRMPKSLLPETFGVEGLTPRVAQVCLFLDQNFDRLSCFDDLKGYITELSFEEARYFIQVMIPKLVGDVRLIFPILNYPASVTDTYAIEYHNTETLRSQGAGTQIPVPAHNLPSDSLRTSHSGKWRVTTLYLSLSSVFPVRNITMRNLFEEHHF